MAQLTIYLPDAVEKKVRADARRAKKTVSAYLSELATRKERAGDERAWRKALLALGGSWEGKFPEIDDAPPEPVDFT